MAVIINTLTIIGSPGDDNLQPTTDSTSSAFVINALAGNDYVVGGDFDDRINGGGGKDTIYGGNGNDRITGGGGKDSLSGDDGNDRIDGGEGNDVVYGGEGKDQITGGAGDDYIDGDDGNDVINAGAGNDTAYGDEGNDTVNGQGGNDVVGGGDGNDIVNGQGGDDTAYGDDGDDTITGGDGDDEMFGGDGNDVLNGNDGFDFYTGNSGNDRFVFDVAGTSSEPEEDAITDFSFGILFEGGKDVIDLRAFDAQIVDVTGSDSQITVVNEGTVPGLPLGSNIKTIYVDLNDDNSAANNTSRAEIVIYVNAGIAGFVRDFIIAEGNNPFADILV